MNTFREQYDRFLCEFGTGRTMVLSTAEQERVSSRMMSIVQIDGLFWFQTGQSMRKYRQLLENPRVALCAENIQIEGICKEVGRPTEYPAFCKAFRECWPHAYELYSEREEERLFVVEPTYLERWLYRDGEPFLERFDWEKQTYELDRYDGK